MTSSRASGTQAPVGLAVSGWLYDSYSWQLVGPSGHSLSTSASTNVLAVPGLAAWLVGPWDVLGGHYGAQLQLWGMTPTYDFPRLGKTASTYGFGDMYLKPAELGWHTPYVDVLAGFALWIPTGRYTIGANNNTGQGQWGYEFSAGATVWFDRGHHLNLATMALYDLYSSRGTVTIGPTSTQLQTGDILYLQGGLGYALLDGGLTFGVPYFVQWKITEDTLPALGGPVLPGVQAGKSWAVGLGAEVDLYWSVSDGVVVRYVQGFSGANTTNGANFFAAYTHIFEVFGTKGQKHS